MTRKMRDVVSGIFLVQGRFLVEKRRMEEDADPSLVAIPGGHVEIGESIEAALKREMKEELGLEVKEARLVGEELYTASNGERQRIHYFVIEKWEGKPKSHEAEQIYWESKLDNLSTPQDKRILRKHVLDR